MTPFSFIKPDKDDFKMLRRAIFGAVLFGLLEFLDPTPKFSEAMMLGAVAYPFITIFTRRDPIIMLLPDNIEVDHTVSPKQVTVPRPISNAPESE